MNYLYAKLSNPKYYYTITRIWHQRSGMIYTIAVEFDVNVLFRSKEVYSNSKKRKFQHFVVGGRWQAQTL